MSQYHKCCTESNCKNVPKSPERPSRPPALTSKPFCDCTLCRCKNCPDILKLLCISVTENSCEFGTNVKKEKEKTCPLHDLGPHQSLLDMVNKDRDCTCEVVAHAVRSNIHMNMGLSERRATINAAEKCSTSRDIKSAKK